MRRLRKIKDGAKQKWHDLPHHHRLAITIGFLISLFLISTFSYRFLSEKRAQTLPGPLLFRAIVEERRQTKHLILRGTVIGSRGKVCFASQETVSNESCPLEFPVIAWSHTAVRAKVVPNPPPTGVVWLLTSDGIKSNELKVSF